MAPRCADYTKEVPEVPQVTSPLCLGFLFWKMSQSRGVSQKPLPEGRGQVRSWLIQEEARIQP